MTYPTTFNILVIILSLTLLVFLVLAITVSIYAIKVLNHLKRITAKAEQVAHNVESVSQFFKHSAGPVAVGKLLSNIIDNFRERKHQTSKKGNDHE